MSALLWWRVGRLGVALVLVFLLLPARPARATDCSGVWRFEVGPLPSEGQQGLSADSWCRAAKLPRAFTAEVRWDANGRPIITGTPHPPADIEVGGGSCEFVFSGPTRGRQYDDVTFEVKASGTVVEGTGRCLEHTRESAEKTFGIGIPFVVTGSHLPATGGSVPGPPGSAVASGPPGPDRLAASIVEACLVRNADALWKRMSPRLRAEVDGRAAQVRSAAGSDLRRRYGYKGRPDDFKGLAYLRTIMNGEDSPANLCWRVKEWEWSPAVPTAAGYVVPVERGDYAMGFSFTKGDQGWQLDQMSQWARIPKP